MAPRAMRQSSQLIHLSAPSARWFQDHNWNKAASASLQPSPAQLEQILKAKPSLLLLWISLIHAVVFSLWASWGHSLCAPQHPSFSRILGRGGRLQYSDFPPCWMVLCLDERAGEEWCWHETRVGSGRCSPFSLPKVQVSRACNWASDKPVQALVVLWVHSGSGRAGQGLRHRPSVALKGVCLPRHCQALFWFRESRKSSAIGEVQLQVSAGNLSYIFLFLKCAFCNLWIYCRSCPGSVLFNTLKYASSLPLPRNCYCIWTNKTWVCSASHLSMPEFLTHSYCPHLVTCIEMPGDFYGVNVLSTVWINTLIWVALNGKWFWTAGCIWK